MTALSVTAAVRPAARRDHRTALLLAVFAAALMVRVAMSTPLGGVHLVPTLVFSAVLLAAVAVVRTSTRVDRRTLAVALAATVAVVVPALVVDGVRGTLPVGDYPAWALTAVVVATAEEAFLRGVLFDAVARRRGVDVAIVATALVFALMHVPFYGWRALPLDAAVGLVLGVARVAAGTWTAPAFAHAAADLVGWWVL
jgi:membrane protease YdiL (CAAX protease family)